MICTILHLTIIIKPRECRDLYVLVSDTKYLLKDHVYWNIFHVLLCNNTTFKNVKQSTYNMAPQNNFGNATAADVMDVE